MARYKKYLDVDVLTMAKQRIRHMFDLFDTVVVMFSGGKDSLVTLHLVWEVAQELGHKQVDVVFRDEELIPDEVIAFVDHYRQLPWIRMRYYAVPLKSVKFILGKTFDYIQWDPAREFLRPLPPHAITLAPGEWQGEAMDQFTADAYIARAYKGKIAFVTGVRADESMTRYRSVVNKLNDNYINASSSPNVNLVKPIYDWSENDLFKYFHDQQITYCPIYEQQHYAGSALRVATPLHAEGAKNIGLLRAISPSFYDRLMRLFPEMLTQERYWKDLDREGLKERHAYSLEGIRAYIDDNFTDENQHAKAMKAFATASGLHHNQPDAYPVPHIYQWIMSGGFKRMIVPLNRNDQASMQRRLAKREAAKE